MFIRAVVVVKWSAHSPFTLMIQVLMSLKSTVKLFTMFIKVAWDCLFLIKKTKVIISMLQVTNDDVFVKFVPDQVRRCERNKEWTGSEPTCKGRTNSMKTIFL